MTDDPGGIPADQRCDYHGLNWKFGCVRCINAKAKYDAALPKLRDMWGKFPNLTRAPKDDPGGIQNIGADMADEIARLKADLEYAERQRDEAWEEAGTVVASGEWMLRYLRDFDGIELAEVPELMAGQYREVRALIAGLRAELDSLRAFKASVDEALNTGDGSYRP